MLIKEGVTNYPVFGKSGNMVDYKPHIIALSKIQNLHSDRYKDYELEEAWKKIDWKRRISAEKSLIEFVNTYLIGLTLDEPPSLKG